MKTSKIKDTLKAMKSVYKKSKTLLFANQNKKIRKRLKIKDKMQKTLDENQKSRPKHTQNQHIKTKNDRE